MNLFKHSVNVLAVALLAAPSAQAAQQHYSVEVQAAPSENTAADADKINVRQADLLRDVLRDVPGVNVGGTNGFNQKIFMRGVSEFGVNIQVDGARQLGDSFHHNGNLLLDPELVKRADVSVGGNSVADGAGSLGGAVKFTTVDASDLLSPGKNIGAKVKTSYNTNNDARANSVLVYGRLVDSVDLLAYYNHKDYHVGKSGGDEYPVGAKVGKDDNYLFKATWFINDDHSVSASTEQVKFAGLYPFKAEFVVTPTAFVPNKSYADYIPQEYVRNTHRLAYAYNPASELWDVAVNVYQTENDLDRTKPHPQLPYEYTVMQKQQDGSMKAVKKGLAHEGGWGTTIKTTGMSASNRAIFATGAVEHQLGVGYEYYQTQNEARDIQFKDGSRKDYEGEKGTLNSVYIEDTLKIGNASVIPGVRYDNYKAEYLGGKNQTISNVSGALGLRYDFDSGVAVFGNYTQLFRAPDTVETIRIRAADSYKQKDDLDPETGDNKELGVSYQGAGLLAANDGLSAVAKIYQTDYDNMIVLAAVPGVAKLNDRVNVGSAKVTGGELSLSYRVNAFSAGVGFSKAKSELTASKNRTSHGNTLYGDALGRAAGDKYTVNLGYAIPQSGVSLNWNSIFFTDFDEDKVHKAGYAVSDVAVQWQPKHALKGLEMSAGVYNLFDKEYVAHTARCDASRKTCADFEPGRAIKVGLAYRFN